MDLAGRHADSRRVTFGEGYLRRSVLECIEENLREYPVLLPLEFPDRPHEFRYLRLHNGTIWRWNRPLLGFDEDGRPHVRIEHRILPAGPSILDMLANAAAYLGMVYALVHEGEDETLGLPFAAARRNFYAAARDGLRARLEWPGAGEASARDLLEGELMPRAARGLAQLGIDAEDIGRYLGVLGARIAGGGSGAAWQQLLLRLLGVPHATVMQDYLLTNDYFFAGYKWNLLLARFMKGERFAESVKGFMMADPSYLSTAFETMDREYGSFETYIRNGPELSAADIDHFKSLYLE